jgi:hypothetical protein
MASTHRTTTRRPQRLCGTRDEDLMGEKRLRDSHDWVYFLALRAQRAMASNMYISKGMKVSLARHGSSQIRNQTACENGCG